MTHLNIKFKKMYEGATAPTKAHSDDCGFDLHAFTVEYDKHGNLVIDTGIAVAIPEGYGGFLFPRSSISKYDLNLTNSVGVIDPSYRGSIIAKFKPSVWFATDDGGEEQKQYGNYYQKGDKCVQLVILPVPSVSFHETFELPIGASNRGEKGYGSSGQ